MFLLRKTNGSQDAAPTLQSRVILPDGDDVPVQVRRSKRARRILLHVDSIESTVELVMPYRVPLSEGLEFAQSKSGWIAGMLRRARPPIRFADGAEIPLLGRQVQIRHFEQRLGAVDRDGDEIMVSGPVQSVPRLVQTWLREEARREIRTLVGEKTAQLGRRYNRITIRDPQTLWGSCSRAGNLSFSWRLVLAPPRILDYVVAHEVAHLAEMNHGPDFWIIVGKLCDDPESSRAWLRANGRDLHRYR